MSAPYDRKNGKFYKRLLTTAAGALCICLFAGDAEAAVDAKAPPHPPASFLSLNLLPSTAKENQSQSTPALESDAADHPPPDDAPPADTAASLPADTAATFDGDFTAFDVDIGGNNYGIVYGTFGDDWFKADHPEELIALLPAVQDKSAFLPLFEGRIEKTKTLAGVGTITVDSHHFKLSLTIAKEQSLTTKTTEYGAPLATDKNLSLRNRLFMAGSTPTEKLDFAGGLSATHDTILSKGSVALEGGGTMTSRNGYALHTALARKDFSVHGHDLTASGGLLEGTGSMHFARSADFTGLRLESNRELLFRDAQLQGSSIEVFLPRRAQVKIFRNRESSGEVLFSRMMEFGTTQIDTRSFPQGSYDIEIITTDDSGVINREVRPFNKSRKLAPHGKPIIALAAGSLRKGTRDVGTPYAEASYKTRLADWLQGTLAVAATDKDGLMEASLSSQNDLHLFQSLGLLESSLTGALTKNGAPAGVEATFNWTNLKSALLFIANKTWQRPLGVDSLALADRSSLNFSASTPFTISDKTISASFSAEVSKSSGSGRAYRAGPALSYRMDTYKGYVPELKMQYMASNTDQRALISLNLRSTDPVWQKTMELAARRSGGDTASSSAVGLGFNGLASNYEDWRRKLEARLDLRADPMTTTNSTTNLILNGNTRYNGTYAKLLGFLNQNLQEMRGQLGGEMDSTALWSPDSGLRATGEDIGATMALLMVKIQGKPDSAEYGISVDGSPRAYGKAGETVVVSLPTYTEATISAFEKKRGSGKDAGETHAVKEQNHVVVGYPGNIIYREFHVSKSYFLMGALIDTQGAPLPQQRFTFNKEVFYSDEDGLFTLEAPLESGSTEKIETSSGLCSFTVPSLPTDNSPVDVGKVTCQTSTPSAQRITPTVQSKP